MTTFDIQPFETSHRKPAEPFMMQHWGSLRIVSRGILYNMLDYPGFVAFQDGELRGIITYRLEGTDCEVLVITSTVEGHGVGSALLDRVKQAAQAAGCKRCWLITTNDNIHAIRWYQKRGFTIAAVYVNALAESRKLKPEIPLIGNDGIPLRDEIEFEIILA